MKSAKVVSLSVALGLLLATGAVYAWSAQWHDPASWISDGAIIQADKLGESLQYLYEISASGSAGTLNGLACTANQIAKWNGTSWVCAQDCI